MIEAFDLRSNQFPLTMTFTAEETGEVIHVIEVPEPGVVRVPALRELYGKVRVRINYGDGSVTEKDA